MTSSAVHIDLTEFIRHPVRTGIQRVIIEALTHWPSATPLIPMMIDPRGTPRQLPPETPDLLQIYFGRRPGDADAVRKQLMAMYPARHPRADLDRGPILNLELFMDPRRIEFYEGEIDRGRGNRLYFLIHDFLPWTAPQWLEPTTGTVYMGYLRIIRRLKHLAFVSRHTHDEMVRRILRRPDGDSMGPIVPNGADGFGTVPADFDSNRRGFVFVGSLDPRKNVAAILDAFDTLWNEGVDTTLTLVGRMGQLEPTDRIRVERWSTDQPRFRRLDDVRDDAVRTAIRNARAMVFPSIGEGSGIPPLEALALGRPVIVWKELPSTAMLPPGGRIELSDTGAASIARAVRTMLDDEVACRLSGEIAALPLPRWADVGPRLAEWVFR